MIIRERKALRWGARKLLRVLRGRNPELDWPARSTISDISRDTGS